MSKERHRTESQLSPNGPGWDLSGPSGSATWPRVPHRLQQCWRWGWVSDSLIAQDTRAAVASSVGRWSWVARTNESFSWCFQSTELREKLHKLLHRQRKTGRPQTTLHADGLLLPASVWNQIWMAALWGHNRRVKPQPTPRELLCLQKMRPCQQRISTDCY